jgi:hypothetical protein
MAWAFRNLNSANGKTVIPYRIRNYDVWGVEDSNLRRLSQQIYRRIVVVLSPHTAL